MSASKLRILIARATCSVLTVGFVGLSSGQITPAPAVMVNQSGNVDAEGSSGDDSFASIATDGDGTWVSVWSSVHNLNGTAGTDSDIFVSRSTDNGATWSATALLDSTGTSDSRLDEQPEVLTDGTGVWLAYWDSKASANHAWEIQFSRSTNGGVTWTSPDFINTNTDTDSFDDANARVAADGNGNWIAVWETPQANVVGGGNFDSDIVFARSTNGGATWSDTALLMAFMGTDVNQDRNPWIATDGEENWVTVWSSFNNPDGTVSTTDENILVSRSINGGVSWTAPARVNTPPGPTDNIRDLEPQVITDGAGTWVTMWMSYPHPDPGPSRSLLASRSTNNGQTWQSPVQITADAEWVTEEFPNHLATDRRGNWIAVWQTQASGGDYDIGYSLSTSGGTSWSISGIVNTFGGSDSASDLNPRLSTDYQGNWVAVWHSTRAFDGIRGDFEIAGSRWFLAPAGPDLNNLYVDFTSPWTGVGTPGFPLQLLGDAVSIANGGATIYLRPADSNETFTNGAALGLGQQPITLQRNGSGTTPVRIGKL